MAELEKVCKNAGLWFKVQRLFFNSTGGWSEGINPSCKVDVFSFKKKISQTQNLYNCH